MGNDPLSPDGDDDGGDGGPTRPLLENVVAPDDADLCGTSQEDKDATSSASCTEYILLTVSASIPSALYVVLFTEMGLGADTFSWLNERTRPYAFPLGAAAASCALASYLLDVETWESRVGVAARRLVLGSLLWSGCVLGVFASHGRPELPLVALSALTPAWLWCAERVVFAKQGRRRRRAFGDFVDVLTGPLLSASGVFLVVFVAWILAEGGGRTFDRVARVSNAQRVGCAPNYDRPRGNETLAYCRRTNDDGGDELCFTVDAENHTLRYDTNTTTTITGRSQQCDEDCVGVYAHCATAVFVVWIGPVLVSLYLSVLAYFTTFFRRGRSDQGSLVREAKLLGGLWALLLAVIWVALSLNGVSNDMFQAAIYFSLSIFATSAVFLAARYNYHELKTEYKATKIKLAEKMGTWVEVFQGLLLVTLSPLAVPVLLLSVLNQSIRRAGCLWCSKQIVEDEYDHPFLTKRLYKLYLKIQRMNHVQIIVYAVYWGILYMSVNVIAAQFVVLLLGVLIDRVQYLSLGMVTLVLLAVGLVMFLIPVVPGVPIYLTLGIVIPASAERSGSGLSLPASVAYCVAVSLALKLFACAVQQKLIGERLSGRVGVRRAVGVNSAFARAMRIILSERGLTVAKVAVLVGGPDWPTSVLCGILRLDLAPVLLGTVPVVLLVAPTVLTGTLTYLGSLENEHGHATYAWASTVSVVCAGLTLAVQGGSCLVAATHVNRALTDRSAEVDALGRDAEVEALEEEERDYEDRYQEVTRWSAVPALPRAALTSSLVAIVATCWLTTLMLSSSFADFELTSTVKDDLDGNVLNFVKPLGWTSLGSSLLSIVLLRIFFAWAKRAANQKRMDAALLHEVILL